MEPSDQLSQLRYLMALTPNPYPYFAAMAQNNLSSNLHITNPQMMSSTTTTNSTTSTTIEVNPTPNSSGLSSNWSTSDEADEQQLSIINERRQRRMISNRESARRSRMRKQRHLDELWSQVLWLRNENQSLVEKLSHVSESHDKVVEENVKLKEQASELRQMLTDMMQLGPTPYSPLPDLEAHITNHTYLGGVGDDNPCNI